MELAPRGTHWDDAGPMKMLPGTNFEFLEKSDKSEFVGNKI